MSWRDERDALLREAGFDDIEDEHGNLRQARNATGNPLSRSPHADDVAGGDINTTAEYYRQAGHYLYDHDFPSDVERRIWELHADGASVSRIRATVRRELGAGELKADGKSVYHKRVHAIVAKHRRRMFGEAEAAKKRRGPKEKSGALHRTGVALYVRLSPAVVHALDHVRTLLKVSTGEAARQGILLLARSTARRDV